jgi:diguanylate cyclase (GGDEF)-like protein
VFRRILRTNSASIRQHLLLRMALALAVTAICVSVASVLAARQEAGRRLDDQAAAARSVFDRSLVLRLRHAHGAARARALSLAAQDASAATGTRATLGAPSDVGRVYGYTVHGGRRLSVVVSTGPVAKATRSALVMGLGIGVGVVLVLVSLMVAGIDRAVAAPLARFAAAIKRAQAGDAAAQADEKGPKEIREAASNFNALLAKVTEQRERLKTAAAKDPLTGVTNNQQFHESLGVELNRAQREGAAVGLVVLDIDGFGSINDAHGRSFGDGVLQRVAEELRRVMRATDLLARIGADDFALILPGADGVLASAIAERARKAVGEASTDERRIACSAGVASYPEDARDGSTLLQLAGGALRWAKASGRGQTRRYDPEHVSVPTDEEERAEIEGLLEREQPVIPFFQPLVSLSTGRILGFEALSRFPEPPGRGPDAWFAQAARCGLAARLEAAALRAALSKEGRPPGTFLSINVSPTTLGSAEVQAVLPVDMSGLLVEVTEHELADDLDALEKELTALRERGARIAVDDAGAGYAGLQQVMRIQPDVIKLDRSLVMNLDQDPAKEALIDSLVRFARRTGASVCAEGIETMEELKLLADLDVTYGQGYVLARPAPEWGTVANVVSESLLRSSLRSQGDMSGKDELPESGDQRLERVSARLSKIHGIEHLEDVFELIAAELGADAVCLSRWVRSENAVESIVDTSGDQPGARFNLSNYASTAHVLGTGEAMQVLVSDPGADLGEVALLGRLGFESLLMVPVVCRDERLGLLEAYSRVERPWTRGEINRARIISYQLGAVLDGLERVQRATVLAEAVSS